MSGLTAEGFDRPTREELLAAIEADQRAGISPTLNLSSTGVVGQLNGVFADRLDAAWQGLDDAYHAFRKGDASGDSLVALALITGTKKQDATPSTVSASVNLESGFAAAARTMVAHVAGDPTRRFVNLAPVANTAGFPTNVPAVFEAETAGPVEVLAGTLTVIAEPLTGWNSITNATDGELGLEADTDAQLRARRDLELQLVGSSTADAIRSDILENLENVLSALVLFNDDDVADANGLPPHSIEVIARGALTGSPESSALAEQIWKSKAAGITAVGENSATYTDEQGNVNPVGFTWVTPRNVWIEIDIQVDGDFPGDGDAQVKAALLGVEAAYDPGSDVVPWRLGAALDQVTGIVNVAAIRLGFSSSPVGTTTLAIAIREIADLDTSRILVTHV